MRVFSVASLATPDFSPVTVQTAIRVFRRQHDGIGIDRDSS
jgi:hypothetical protein